MCKSSLPLKAKELCDEIFLTDIKYTTDLFNITTKLFYPTYNLEKTNIEPIIMPKIDNFLEKFCSELNKSNEVDKALFLLLLRTNFHVWYMDVYLWPNWQPNWQPKSFIVLTNKNLFSNICDKNKWILLYFSSTTEILPEWNTSFLKEDIRSQLVGVNDSNFLRYEFFNQIKNRVEICSNEKENSLFSYMNDQTYFFNIIKSIFFSSKNNCSEYHKITNGVILKKYKKSTIFQKLGDHLNIIFNGEKHFDHSVKKNEWNPIFNCIHDIFNIYNDCNFDTFELINNDKVESMSRFNFTVTFVKKFVISIIRLTLNQPVFMLINPGNENSLCISFLNELVKIASKDEDFIWKSHQNNVNREQQQDKGKEVKKSSSDKSTNINNNCIDESNNHLLNDEKNSDIVEPQQIHFTSIDTHLNVDKITRILSRVGIKTLPS